MRAEYRRLLLVATLCAALPAAAAEEPAQRPTEGFGLDRKDCPQWTDGCVVCKTDTAGEAQCSTPGAGCVAKEPSCALGTGK